MVELEKVRAAAEAKTKATAEATRLELELRELIQEAFADDNVRLKDLIEATGLSKARLYQIRDGRR
ncbi:conserved hypothetical protein [Arthrobacter sp. 9V]|uniref:hypothetical protein n=1 Tax=Arthrobacter sp. 9V TaxID=2653132 RepID=UPI0012F3AE97|nr:hypothetical protein [Arthrobacter sp. 9V]VXB24265.1 conserved hypothetical protein [Arthrobacter sp. 9V]